MSAVWVAVWVGLGAPALLVVTKRLVDYVLPPDRHWPLLDRFSRPNEDTIKEDTDEN